MAEDLDLPIKFLALEPLKGFLWFWLRPEGAPTRRGFNLTIIGKNSPLGCARGFVLILRHKRRYRFRFRLGIKPRIIFGSLP